MTHVLRFQDTPFNSLFYSLQGDDKGPTYFAIDSTEGVITIKEDLKADSDVVYKVSIDGS